MHPDTSRSGMWITCLRTLQARDTLTLSVTQNVVFVTRDMGHGVVSNCDIEVQSLLQDAFIREFL